MMSALGDLRSLRAQAYVILAWGHLRHTGVKDLDPLESIAWSAARRLVECYQRAQRPDWQWFERDRAVRRQPDNYGGPGLTNSENSMDLYEHESDHPDDASFARPARKVIMEHGSDRFAGAFGAH